jgi:acyl-[acyl-carrier-protein]-phospholipid O-acyltransferase/long-chain-fatty-acid--[acyl-carrier-protein] ligase
MADSTGQSLTYGRALVGSLLLGRVIRRLTADQAHVGVLLPSSVGGAIANIAVLAAGRVPVNLNFTAGPEAMALAVEQAGIRTIVTSRKFLSKAGLERTPAMVFLEDLRGQVTSAATLLVLLEARLLPMRLLRRRHGGRHTSDALATIIFSSGSTGVPKGVLITHRNILANIDGLAQIFPMDSSDCFIGVLPFFHAFGLTGTLWFPLLQGAKVVYHPNPVDARTIGELAERHRGTMLISTPTFCSAYLKRCTQAQFAHLKYAIVGAEKLREPLATAFEQQFGVRLLEGYGCTEMAPVVAVNRPDVAHGGERQVGTKFGSVGHPIPGVAARIVDRETGEGPLIGREGLLLVKGPNMMAGYLHQPERTAEVIRDGWYVTGDLAMMDEDGFIFITDRLSRFSKIGGEMVPHLKIEDAIDGVLGEACSAVTSLPDAARGERLVAFYTRADVTPSALWDQLCATDLPRLWLPRRDCLLLIDAIPTLGTGKVDLRRVRQLAAEQAGETIARS